MTDNKHIIKTLILAELKREEKVSRYNDSDLDKFVFVRSTSLRLTFQGYKLLSNVATCYVYRHDDDFKAKHLIGLSQLKYPYYLSTKFFILFSEEDSLLVSLHGTATGFLENSFLFRNNS